MKNIVFGIMILLCSLTSAGYGQSKLSDFFNKNTLSEAANNLLSTNTLTATDIEGTWKYVAPACMLESDDLLKKAGGSLIASQINEQLKNVYDKVGIKTGAFDFTFNADSTFISKSGSKTLQGTYFLKNDTITLEYKLAGLIKTGTVTAHIQKTNDKLSMLFNADKLLQLFSSLCSITQNKTLGTIAQIADGYDGMLIGYELNKE